MELRRERGEGGRTEDITLQPHLWTSSVKEQAQLRGALLRASNTSPSFLYCGVETLLTAKPVWHLQICPCVLSTPVVLSPRDRETDVQLLYRPIETASPVISP